MNKITFFLLFIFTFYNVNAQGPGDNCVQAIAVNLGVHSYSTINGDEPPADCVGQFSNGTNGEWYSFTHDTTENITVSTDLAINNGADTRLHVYTGSCNTLTCVDGDDDSGNGLLSTLTFQATANTTYYIVFDNRWGSTGRDFEISVGGGGNTTSPINFTQQNLTITGEGRAIVDMNGDFLDDIVSITSTNINIHYQTATGFSESNFTTESAATPSWSLAAGDIDKNGFNDLLYGNGSAVTFMKANDTGTGYNRVYGSGGVFSQRSNFVDIDNDGHLDAFVCHDVEPNVYFINDKFGNLVYYQTFLGGAPYELGDDAAGGNYGSIWVDYDNDRDIDMFIAKCRGGNPTISINEMYTNDGNNNYTENAADLNLADNMQTWSSAWGDFDNDGDMDVFVGASSGSHKLMRNDMNTTGGFTNITSAQNVASLNATSIETTTYDLDNDGNLDLISGEHVLFGDGNMAFTLEANLIGASRRAFGDINNDGFLDVFSENGTVFTNNTNNNNWITINTIGTDSNINGIGARVELHTPSGVQIRDVRSGDGFRFMSSLNTHFGMGTEDTINNVIIYWPSGTVDNIPNLSINTVHTIVEGQSLSVTDQQLESLSIFPNPVADNINIKTAAVLNNKIASIFDINGKRVLNKKLTSNSINVSKLQSGVYILRIESNGKTINRKFIKN
ncbi:MAG: FG-GAP-like repeat-containing protein [Oceanihabitans sp.]